MTRLIYDKLKGGNQGLTFTRLKGIVFGPALAVLYKIKCLSSYENHLAEVILMNEHRIQFFGELAVNKANW